MASWTITYLPEALEDFKKLDGSVKPHVVAAIRKTSQNPLPQREGALAWSLGKKLDST